MTSKVIGRWLVVVKDTKRFGVVVDVCDKNGNAIISYSLKTFLCNSDTTLKLVASDDNMTMNETELYNATTFVYEAQPVDMSRHINGCIKQEAQKI